MISENLLKELTRQHYKLVGGHSACKACLWTRKSIRNQGVCYKQLWYGIQSHRCMQMTPYIACDQRCVFCWRIIERTSLPKHLEFDSPESIADGCIEAQRLLLNGFPGYEGTDMKKWKEAQNPTNAAISLLGEPALYPMLSGLIEEFRNRRITTFLVTNGQHPEALGKLEEPTQLYISVDAADRETLARIDRPGHAGFWERLNQSLEIMASMECRKVIRLTLVKGYNMENPEGYAKLISMANPDFVELKGYMHVGESQKRLPREAMPLHSEILDFSKRVSAASSYRLKSDFQPSRVALLSKT